MPPPCSRDDSGSLRRLVTAILFTVLYGLTRSGPLVTLDRGCARRSRRTGCPAVGRSVRHMPSPSNPDHSRPMGEVSARPASSHVQQLPLGHEGLPHRQGAYGTYVSNVVTPRTCAYCHPAEAKQFAFSRHGVPAWTALVGYAGLSKELQEQFDRISEIRHALGGGELPTGLVGSDAECSL